MPVFQKDKHLELKHLIPAWEVGLCRVPVAVALTSTCCMENVLKETTKSEGKRDKSQQKSAATKSE